MQNDEYQSDVTFANVFKEHFNLFFGEKRSRWRSEKPTFWSFLNSFVISIFAPSEVIDAAESFPSLQIPLASLSVRKGKEGNL